MANHRRAQSVENKDDRQRAGEKAEHNQNRGRHFHNDGDNRRQGRHRRAGGGHVLHRTVKAQQFGVAKKNKQNHHGDAGDKQQQRAGSAKIKIAECVHNQLVMREVLNVIHKFALRHVRL